MQLLRSILFSNNLTITVKGFLFVCDIIIVDRDKSAPLIKQRIQDVITNIEKWAKYSDFKLTRKRSAYTFVKGGDE